MMYIAFTYEENTHEQIYVCYGKTKRDAAGLFFTRTKWMKLPCWLCKSDEKGNPTDLLELAENWMD